jgi:hypothetical protein
VADQRDPRFDTLAVALAELRVRLEHLAAEARAARRRSVELRTAAALARRPKPTTRARVRGEEYELVHVTEEGLWVLADASGRLLSFDGGSPIDRPEVRCDFCGRWSLHAVPVRRGLWASWMCFGGMCAPLSSSRRRGERAAAGRERGPTGA